MPVIEETVSFSTKGNNDIVNITALVEQKLGRSKLAEGIVSIFVPGATGGITTIEYEPGLIKDFKKLMEKLVPQSGDYEHDAAWGDGNGHSHLRASLVGPEITVPFTTKRLQLGTWQQIVFLDFDNRPRKRTLIMKIIGC
jgi:secondary thiamine-phosphate synthase enzyme